MSPRTSLQIGGRIADPYIDVGTRSSSTGAVAVKCLLRERALLQARTMVAAIAEAEVESVAPHLAALDRETDGLASRRVSNMLHAFQFCLARQELFGGPFTEEEASHMKVFEPIQLEDLQRLTSPALLVLQAVLYSHSQWAQHQAHHHEAYSAWEAYNQLDSFEDGHREFIAALIAHQTLVRSAWYLRGKPGWRREIALVDESTSIQPLDCSPLHELKKEDVRRLGAAIGRTLRPFVAESDLAKLAAAQVLFSLCLDCRHQRVQMAARVEGGECGPWPKEDMEVALEFATYLRCHEKNQAKTRLLHWQFGHQVMDARGVGCEEEYGKWVRSFNASGSGESNLCISFDPGVPRACWAQDNSVPSEASEFSLGRLSGGEKLRKKIQATVGSSVRVEVSAADQVCKGLGIDGVHISPSARTWLNGKKPDTEETTNVYNVLKELVCAALKKNSMWDNPSSERRETPAYDLWKENFENGFLAVPLMGRILMGIRRARPDQFGLLRLRPWGLPGEISEESLLLQPFSIYLPIQESHEKSVEGMCGLLARYVAAMIINIQVSLAPTRVNLDFFETELRDGWQRRIERALEWMGGTVKGERVKGIVGYLEQYRAEKCESDVYEAVSGVKFRKEVGECAVSGNGFSVVGVDIGASSIKISRWRVDDGLVKLIPGKEPKSWTLPTKPPGGALYESTQALATRIVCSVCEKVGEAAGGIVGVGVAWPGAVRGRRYVAAPSGILELFEGVDAKGGTDPRVLHKLDLKQAFEDAFRRKAKADTVVTVINDGAAEIHGEEGAGWESDNERACAVMKLGTGTAFAVFLEGRIVEVMGEFGKAVLNIEPKLTEQAMQRKGRRWPMGLVNGYCSSRAFGAVAASLGWIPSEGPRVVEAKEVGYFLESDEGNKEGMARDIGTKRIEVLKGQDDVENKALEIAKRVGFLVASGVALLVDLFRCQQVRLGGGALKGETGPKVCKAAAEALRGVYGLEVKESVGGSALGGGLGDPHMLREVTSILLVCPPEGGDTNPAEVGAARLGLEAYVRERKRRSLVELRSKIMGEIREKGLTKLKVEEALEWDESGLLVVQEVEELLRSYVHRFGMRLRDGEYEIVPRAAVGGRVGGE